MLLFPSDARQLGQAPSCAQPAQWMLSFTKANHQRTDYLSFFVRTRKGMTTCHANAK
jgi:hypothetical protein